MINELFTKLNEIDSVVPISGHTVARYLKQLGSDDGNRGSGRVSSWVLRKVSEREFYLIKFPMKEILNDADVAHYIDSGESRYSEADIESHGWLEDDINNPIVVIEYNGKPNVVDGYNRILLHYRKNEDTIQAYVDVELI